MNLEVFLGSTGSVSFDIDLYDTPFVKKWVSELQWCLDNCQFNQLEAFAGCMDLDESQQVLISSCDLINQYIKNYIDIRSDMVSQPQEYFNYLHMKFEQLSGAYGTPTRLFAVAPPDLKTAIRNLNFFVHRIEKKLPVKKNLYLSFDKDCYRRHALTDTDYNEFQFSFPAGTLCLHYAELGKEFADLYEDRLPITYDNCKNLHYYSAEASLMLSEYNAFQDPGYVSWLKSHRIDPGNKKLGHGKIPLGHVDNPALVHSKISHNRHLYKIIIKE